MSNIAGSTATQPSTRSNSKHTDKTHEKDHITMSTMSTIPVGSPRPASAGVGSPFARTFRSDIISATTVRSNKVMAAVVVAVSGAAAALVSLDLPEEGVTADPFSLIQLGSLLALFLATVAGVLAFTTDLQHGSMRSALVAQPSRTAAWASRATVAVLIGSLFGALSLVAGSAGSTLNGVSLGEITEAAPDLLWLVAVTALAALAGVGFAMIVRSTAISISVLLAWWLIVEPALTAVIGANVRFLPFTAAYSVVHNDSDLSRFQGLLVFGVFAAALVTLGLVLFNRRDVN